MYYRKTPVTFTDYKKPGILTQLVWEELLFDI